MRAADVIVVVSGTDGALPSVVAGLVDTPVVSFPARQMCCGASLASKWTCDSALTVSKTSNMAVAWLHVRDLLCSRDVVGVLQL